MSTIEVKDGNNISKYFETSGDGTLASPFKMIQQVVKNELGYDAWGRLKTVTDRSLFHGMFTYNVPVKVWEEDFNGTIQPATLATSVDGELHLVSGNTVLDDTTLRSFRHPRYQPNRGHLYSSSIFLPVVGAAGTRSFGMFTSESGVFFSLISGALFAVVRTTIGGITTVDGHAIDTTGIDLTKGNIYDIQMQWRGVGNYRFFINNVLVKEIEYLGTRDNLTMFNPANPVAFQCVNNGDEVEIVCGCVDVTSEGGDSNGKEYGSVGISNNAGQVALTGYNVPIIAIRSKLTVNSLINTRDTLALLSSAYGDQRCVFRVWSTRDFTAITENNQSWSDFGDGHLEYIEYDNPDVVTPMSFDTAKADLIFSARINQDETYATSALFEGRTEIYQTPGDMFVFTLHRETGGAMNGGITYEFAEAI